MIFPTPPKVAHALAPWEHRVPPGGAPPSPPTRPPCAPTS